MICGRTINLRRLRMDDLQNILKWRQDAELMRYYDMLPIDMPLEIEEELKGNINSAKRVDFIIETKKAESIGTVYLKKINWKDRHTELHIMVAERKKGYGFFGSEAAFLLLLYAFRQLNMHKIYGRVIEYAKEVENLVKEIGFIREAVLRKSIYQKGRYWDLYIYGLLDMEFKKFLDTTKGQKCLSASHGSLEG
jgi:RimJ/RimL family protein N-acetyltransferase